MKRHLFSPFSFVLLLSLSFMACDMEKEEVEVTMGNLHLIAESIYPGDSLHLSYTKESVELGDSYVHSIGRGGLQVMDLSFDDEQKASLMIPDSALAIAILPGIEGREEYDTRDGKGYLIPVNYKDDEMAARSAFAVQYYMYSIGPRYDFEREPDEVFDSMQVILSAYPELNTNDRLREFYRVAAAAKSEDARMMIDAQIADLEVLENPGEEDYELLAQLYSTGDKKNKVDSIKDLTIEKFPRGKMALQQARIELFKGESSTQDKVTQLEKLRSDFDLEDEDLGTEYYRLAGAFSTEEDFDNFQHYAKKITDRSRRAGAYNNLAWDLAEKGKDLSFAEQISKQSLQLLNDVMEDPREKPLSTSTNQFLERLESTKSSYADTYALIRFKQGETKEAIKYQKMAVADERGSEDMNQRYVQYLEEDGQIEEIETFSRDIIQNGFASEDIKEAFLSSHSKLNPEADAEDALTTLEEKAYEELKKEISDDLIDEEAPPFTLVDTRGEKISLSDYRGKTVILDFWATWCGPCKQSFPGMQEMVEQYAGDDDIKFFFIDTWERGDDVGEKVQSFISENDYDFHVLLDNWDEESDQFEVVTDYGVKGIPTKFILGPNGKIRHKSVGFGGTKKLKTEMEIVLGLLKT